MALPTEDLRSNRGTWLVPTERLPALGSLLCDLLPREPFDPDFDGQRLTTTYLDTPRRALRRARRDRCRYLTLRIRCYRPSGDGAEVYALSAKTEDRKPRIAISADDAAAVLGGSVEPVTRHLPADLLARLAELTDGALVQPVASVHCLRYGVEDEQDRLTLDCGIHTDADKRLYCGVLEFKSNQPADPPVRLRGLRLTPIKLSKFLWAAEV
jgi:hypothetical protein